jgi:ABC-type protease/lipase transport system fused ATPase/permease subunit
MNNYVKSIILLLLVINIALISVQSASLSWNVSATTNKKDGEDRSILSYATGKATQGKLHAIIGPSGSGKVS